MNTRKLAVCAILVSLDILVILLYSGLDGLGKPLPVLAAPRQVAPTVAQVDSTSASNDLDTPIVITGTGFTATPTVRLDAVALTNVGWVSSTQLTATVPWGLNPSVYDLTVVNPDGLSGTLTNAFTVTQGIGAWNSGDLFGGEVYRIAINPITTTTVYAVSGVGLFRSRDAGANWSYIFSTTPINSVALDPVAPNHIYLGTWELFRSDDEGDTWTKLFSDWPGGGNVASWQVYTHPITSGVVFVAGAAYAGDSNPGNGIWKSTDYGATWNPANTGLTGDDLNVTALAFMPGGPQTMFAGTAGGKLFHSTDGGDSWSYVSQPLSSIDLIRPNPITGEVWVSHDCTNSGGTGALAKSDASLTAWAPVDDIRWCITSLEFGGPETVYIGARWGGSWGNGWVTTDDGDNWFHFGASTTAHDIEPVPGSLNTIYTGDLQYGVQKTTDGGTTWTVVHNSLRAMVPLHMATTPARPSEVLAVMPNWPGIFKSDRGGDTWHFLPVPVSAGNYVHNVLIDLFSPSRIYVAADDGVYISDNDGQTWGSPVTITPNPLYGSFQAWVLVADPSKSGALLLGGFGGTISGTTTTAGDIFRSTDFGEHWTHIDQSQEIPFVDNIVFDPAHAGRVYATTRGTVFLSSDDGGLTWQIIPVGGSTKNYLKTLTIEPVSPYRLFARFNLGPIVASTTEGLSWSNVNGPSCGSNALQLLFTPSVPPALYAATTTGLCRSTDGGQNWQRAAGALGYANVQTLAVVATTDRIILYAGISGGTVNGGAAPTRSRSPVSQSLVNAGVYRYTTRLSNIFLPFVRK